jgi:hypothetical protein
MRLKNVLATRAGIVASGVLIGKSTEHGALHGLFHAR